MGYVANTTTINGHALSSDVTVTKSDLSLGNVVNLDTSTTANITDSSNKRFITDAQLTVLGNTSGTNTGNQTITLTGDVTGTGTGSFATAIKASVLLTTPVIGVATGTSLAVTGLVTSSGTSGIGYATGAGGTVTQATNKSTGVTLSKTCGAITMNAAALAAATIVSFTLTNTTIAATDVLVLNHISGGTPGSYTLNARAASGSAIINVRNNTAGSLSEAIVIQFVIIKAVTS